MGICNDNRKKKIKTEKSHESQPKSLLESQNDSNDSNQQATNISSNINSQNKIQQKEESNLDIKLETGNKEQVPALNKYQTETILYQMSNSVCRFDLGKKTGTGFICLIPYPNIEHQLKVLITCNHVFNDKKQEIK